MSGDARGRAEVAVPQVCTRVSRNLYRVHRLSPRLAKRERQESKIIFLSPTVHKLEDAQTDIGVESPSQINIQ